MAASAATLQAALRVRLFGRVQIALGETPVPDDAWPRRTARTLLLLLLSAPGYRLPRETVIEHLWPESSPESAAKSFYVAVHALRRVLEPDLRSGRSSSYVDVSGDVVRLLPGAVEWVDIDEFETLLSNDGGDRRQQLSTALALYSGDFLADEPYLDWPSIRREHLRGRWREAVLEYADLERTDGRPLLAVPAIERVLQSDPTDETAFRALMSALAAAGRREDALRQYDRCAATLRDEIGVEPGEETEALADEIRTAPAASPSGAVAASGAASRRIDNLPAPPNALVGRARDVEELLDLLLQPDIRLVTVTGPGGVGKTRLALEAASLATDEFEDGVCFVSLAPVRDPALVLPVLARALGIEDVSSHPPLESVTAALHDRQLLLLLDNLEQVLDVSPELAELLAACPRIVMLITSREPLHLRSEHDFPLGPLPVPDPDRLITAGSAARFPSVELFIERAGAVHRGFTLNDDNAASIGLLCARLDGLPLAIELAAARARHQRPDQLVAGLADRFSLLSGGFRDLPDRQRTMRGAIAWSYDLLPPDEQALFRRLAIFVGGFTAEAAVAIAAPDTPGVTQDRLDALVDKGLLRLDDDAAEPRYAMLETIREYGLELLVEQGELAAAGQAHAAWCVALAERAGPELTGANQADWFERLDREHANIRAALDRLIRDPAGGEPALRLSAPIWRFWWSKGYSREGRVWFERALAAAPHAPPAVHAAALYAAGELAEELGEYEDAVSRFEAALVIRRELNDPVGTAEVLNGLGIAARNRGEFMRAEELHQEAYSLLESFEGNQRTMANTLNNLGSLAYFRGDRELAGRNWEQALALVREAGDQRAALAVLGNLGALALMEQETERAIAIDREALGLARRLNDYIGITRSMVNLAGAIFERGDHDASKALFEEALPRTRETGDRFAEAIVLYDLGKIAESTDDLTGANARFGESLGIFHGTHNLPGVAACLERIATLAAKQGEALLATTLFGAGETLRTTTGASREPVDNGEYEKTLSSLRARLTDEAFAAAWAEGAALSTEDAVALALGTRQPHNGAPPHTTS